MTFLPSASAVLASSPAGQHLKPELGRKNTSNDGEKLSAGWIHLTDSSIQL